MDETEMSSSLIGKRGRRNRNEFGGRQEVVASGGCCCVVSTRVSTAITVILVLLAASKHLTADALPVWPTRNFKLLAKLNAVHPQVNGAGRGMINEEPKVAQRQMRATHLATTTSSSSRQFSVEIERRLSLLSRRFIRNPTNSQEQEQEKEHDPTESDRSSYRNLSVAASNSSNQMNNRQQLQEQTFQRRLMELKLKYMTNRAISNRAYYTLLVIYSLFIIVGTISNSLICLTVILRPRILSPRNIFIVNLAGSDLLLCVFTMPFSFIEISMKMWHMGLIPCKLVAGLQATSIFVSTISITAIALDRYKVIVYPTHQETASGTRGAFLLLASVWIGALLLSLPLFSFRTVEHMTLPHKYDTIESIDFCVEAWPFDHGRGIYSVISMIFQYVLPITIVSVVYAKISDKLQKRLIRRQKLTQLECQQKRQLNLIRRTHTMLVSVSLIFGLSWLPLNLLNVIGDFSDLFKGDDQLFRIVFAICHLIGCSSACTNPILYGYLNENFRKEFHSVYTHHVHRLMRLFRRLCLGLNNNRPDDPDYIPSTPTSSSSASASVQAAALRRSSGRFRCKADTNKEISGAGVVTQIDDDDDQTSSGQDDSESQDSSNSSSSGSEELEIMEVSKHRHAQLVGRQKYPNGTCSMRVVLENNQLEDNSNNNNNDNDNNLNVSARRQSFQTMTSSRQTLGRTMKFCLCISGSSSIETLAGNHNNNILRGKRSRTKLYKFEADERKRRRKRSKVIQVGGVDTEEEAGCSIDAQEDSCFGDGNELKHKHQNREQEKEERKRHRKRRKRKEGQTSGSSLLDCKCQCHNSSAFGNDDENGCRNNNSAKMMIDEEVNVTSQVNERNTSPMPPTLDHIDALPHSTRALNSNGGNGSGRRVWLRFFTRGKSNNKQQDSSKRRDSMCLVQSGASSLVKLASKKLVRVSENSGQSKQSSMPKNTDRLLGNSVSNALERKDLDDNVNLDDKLEDNNDIDNNYDNDNDRFHGDVKSTVEPKLDNRNKGLSSERLNGTEEKQLCTLCKHKPTCLQAIIPNSSMELANRNTTRRSVDGLRGVKKSKSSGTSGEVCKVAGTTTTTTMSKFEGLIVDCENPLIGGESSNSRKLVGNCFLSVESKRSREQRINSDVSCERSTSVLMINSLGMDLDGDCEEVKDSEDCEIGISGQSPLATAREGERTAELQTTNKTKGQRKLDGQETGWKSNKCQGESCCQQSAATIGEDNATSFKAPSSSSLAVEQVGQVEQVAGSGAVNKVVAGASAAIPLPDSSDVESREPQIEQNLPSATCNNNNNQQQQHLYLNSRSSSITSSTCTCSSSILSYPNLVQATSAAQIRAHETKCRSRLPPTNSTPPGSVQHLSAGNCEPSASSATSCSASSADLSEFICSSVSNDESHSNSLKSSGGSIEGGNSANVPTTSARAQQQPQI